MILSRKIPFERIYMNTKLVSGVMLAISVLHMLIAFYNITPVVASTTPTVRRFRLLAVERQFDNCNMRSAEYLIDELLHYQNWNNGTTEYVSYIHLLSMFPQDEVFDVSKLYWRGTATKKNVQNEIINFLGQASPGEIVIFYYVGHSFYFGLTDQAVLTLDDGINATELTSWLSSGGLPHASVVVILDTCYSGWWIKDGLGGVLGPGRTVLTACRTSQNAWGWCWDWSWFTYIGLIQGFWYAEDPNNDGWISAIEDFAYAKPNTEDYAAQFGMDQSPVSFFGVVEGDVPLIQRDPTKPFPNWDISIISIQTDNNAVTVGTPVLISVVVENQGVKLYTGNVTVYYENEWIGSQAVSLMPGESVTLKFIWNTTDVLPGSYTISAVASVAPGEIDLDDNTYIDGTITLLSLLADLTGRSVWPERSHFSLEKHGIQTLYGLVKNLGEGECYIRVQFLLVDKSGVIGVIVAKNLVNGVETKVASGQTITLAVDLWDESIQPLKLGKYYVRATCIYSAVGTAWKLGERTKIFSFSIVA